MISDGQFLDINFILSRCIVFLFLLQKYRFWSSVNQIVFDCYNIWSFYRSKQSIKTAFTSSFYPPTHPSTHPPTSLLF